MFPDKEEKKINAFILHVPLRRAVRSQCAP
ncbi:TPA_asm: hypothetical protein [Porphyromonas phage phage030a_KCOM2803]|uniref:Uncharacterized protein n=2 Tax=Nixviridae TaxID=3424665 RepID=A0AAT9J9K8_9CAUD